MKKAARYPSGDGDRLSAENVAPFLGRALPRAPLYVYSSVASTNTLAKELAAAGAVPGTAVIAERQTGGKGRMGRSFYSPPGAGIYLSVILRPGMTAEGMLMLTTGAAVAAARAIETLRRCQVRIKWVNDLYLAGRKIGGILAEASLRGETSYAVLGIGVNVRKSAEGFPAELREKAGVLCGEGEFVSRSRLAAALINHVREMAEGLENRPEQYARELIAEAKERSCVLGKEVLAEYGGQRFRGRAADIDGRAYLVIEDEKGGRLALGSGEISLRGAEGEAW